MIRSRNLDHPVAVVVLAVAVAVVPAAAAAVAAVAAAAVAVVADPFSNEFIPRRLQSNCVMFHKWNQ
jgi:hypothetical protein